MVGFDGFVDAIIQVVDKRYDSERFEAVATIERFGQKVLAAAGRSSNYELVVKTEKLGGNGPIMANALASLGLAVTYVGALGYPKRHHVFDGLAKRVECFSIAEAAHTDALEFADGKLMLGRMASLKDVSWQRIRQVIGADRFASIVARSGLIAMVNWTMLPMINGIWRGIIDELLSQVPQLGDGQTGGRQVFIDLADPEKRTAEDLRGALELCAAFQPYADVTLGLNLKESTQVAAVLGLDAPVDAEAAIESTAVAIREKLNIHIVVIHPRGNVAAATVVDGATRSVSFVGPLVAQPQLSTGAGDNFNAGFCVARLAGLPIDEALCVGTAASGYYVRHAASPTLNRLADFCDHLPEPED